MNLHSNKGRVLINSCQFDGLTFKYYSQSQRYYLNIVQFVQYQNQGSQLNQKQVNQTQKVCCEIKLRYINHLYTQKQVNQYTTLLPNDFSAKIIVSQQQLFQVPLLQQTEAIRVKIKQKAYLVLCSHKQILVKQVNSKQSQIDKESLEFSKIQVNYETFNQFCQTIKHQKIVNKFYKSKQTSSKAKNIKIKKLSNRQQQITQICSLIQLKHLLQRLMLNVIYARNINILFCIKLIVVQKQTSAIFLYNIESVLYIYIKFCLKSQLNIRDFHSMVNKLYPNQVFEHSVNYYSKLFDLMKHMCQKLPTNQNSFFNLLKLAKYFLIQKVPLQQTFTVSKSQNKFREIQNKIQDLQFKRLNQNSFEQKNIIVYMMLGMPGLNKSKLLEELKRQLQNHSVSILLVKPVVKNQCEKEQKCNKSQLTQCQCQKDHNHDKLNTAQLCQFINKQNLFQKQKYAFIILDYPFSQPLLNDICLYFQKQLSQKRKDIFYQIKLIVPEQSQQQFFIDTDLQKEVTYGFSLQVILAALLNVQKRRHHQTFNGQNIQSLAKMFHVISSTYQNILPFYAHRKVIGNITFIHLSFKVQIDWKQQDKEQIKQNLRLLLFQSYKGQFRQQNLLWYFLQSLQNLQVEFKYQQNFCEKVLQLTFEELPFIDFS